MVKRNTKSTRKKLTKKQKQDIANKLENTVQKVSKKGLFFKTKDKFGEWTIVDGKTKNVLFSGILLVESANIMLRTLNQANPKQLQKIIPSYEETLRNYQDAVHKHLNDIFFYKHTMKTTKDNVLFYATEARVDMSLMKLRHCREELHNKLEINSLHGIHLVK
tara:strand:- start:1762 stop:2250 length:489 start_codon:yes stop_codon:yes gene_type:complete